MDLLFSRYANPFLFVDTLIKSNSLYKGLLSVIQVKDDEMAWQMYCSLLANPMNKIKSYKEFKNNLYGKRGGVQDRHTNKLKENEVKQIAEKSNNILNNFKPQ